MPCSCPFSPSRLAVVLSRTSRHLTLDQEQYKFCYRVILEFYESRRLFRDGVLDSLVHDASLPSHVLSPETGGLTPVKPVVKQSVQVIVPDAMPAPM